MLMMRGRAFKDMKKHKIGLAVSDFYPDLALSLVDGVREVFSPLSDQAVLLQPVRTPGSSELPLTADWLFQYGQCSAVIGLGAVIQGRTSHYDSVCRMVEQGFIQVQLKWSKPVISGVLMVSSLEQAKDRLSPENHKGKQSAQACLKMLNLLEFFKS